MRFGDIIAYVCAMTGWTWDYVADHITLPRLATLQRQWLKYPPAALVAGLNMIPASGAAPAAAAAPSSDLDELTSFAQLFGGTITHKKKAS